MSESIRKRTERPAAQPTRLRRAGAAIIGVATTGALMAGCGNYKGPSRLEDSTPPQPVTTSASPTPEMTTEPVTTEPTTDTTTTATVPVRQDKSSALDLCDLTDQLHIKDVLNHPSCNVRTDDPTFYDVKMAAEWDGDNGAIRELIVNDPADKQFGVIPAWKPQPVNVKVDGHNALYTQNVPGGQNDPAIAVYLESGDSDKIAVVEGAGVASQAQAINLAHFLLETTANQQY